MVVRPYLLEGPTTDVHVGHLRPDATLQVPAGPLEPPEHALLGKGRADRKKRTLGDSVLASGAPREHRLAMVLESPKSAELSANRFSWRTIRWTLAGGIKC